MRWRFVVPRTSFAQYPGMHVERPRPSVRVRDNPSVGFVFCSSWNSDVPCGNGVSDHLHSAREAHAA